MKQTSLIAFLFLIFAFSASAQTEPPAKIEITQETADKCARAIDESLASRTAIDALKAELVTNKDLRAKESAYNGELLKAVALLTSAERRDKSFFRKLTEQIGRVLKAATDPQALATAATLIVIIRNLK